MLRMVTEPSWTRTWRALLLISGAAVTLATRTPIQAQGTSDSESDVQMRQIWNDAFRAKRAEAQARTQRPATVASTKKPGSTAGKAGSAPGATTNAAAQLADSLVGVTVWRLRRATNSDEGSQRALVFQNGDDSLIAERVHSRTVFRPGDRVRVSIESGRSGYLYLIDRELYADGSTGDPYVIFPRARIRGGENRVSAGRLVEIPALSDSPSFFTMRQSRPDHVGDELIVLVTPKPLTDLALGSSGPLRLPRARMAELEKGGATLAVQELGASGASGLSYTAAEKAAAGDDTRMLTYDGPLPETLYRFDASLNQSVMVRVPLHVKGGETEEE